MRPTAHASYAKSESDIFSNRKFFGKPNGTTAPPRQSKLTFSTKSTNGAKFSRQAVTSDETEADAEENAVDIKEEPGDVKKEEEDGDDVDIEQETASPNGYSMAS